MEIKTEYNGQVFFTRTLADNSLEIETVDSLTYTSASPENRRYTTIKPIVITIPYKPYKPFTSPENTAKWQGEYAWPETGSKEYSTVYAWKCSLPKLLRDTIGTAMFFHHNPIIMADNDDTEAIAETGDIVQTGLFDEDYVIPHNGYISYKPNSYTTEKYFTLEDFQYISICPECHEIIDSRIADDIDTVDGTKYHIECLENGDFSHCGHCGEWIDNSDSNTVYVETGRGACSQEWCDDCRDSHAFRCDDCDNYFSMADVDNIYDDNHTYCSRCAENYYTCERCNCLVHSDNTHTRRDSVYCSECYSEMARSIHGYTYKPQTKFHHISEDDKAKKLYYGIELEIDDGDDESEMADALGEIDDDESDYYLKHDGSLGSRGIEIVTHPRTMASWIEYKDTLAEIETACKNNNYKSHNTDTCGLHIHASRAGIEMASIVGSVEDTIGKVIYLYEKLYTDFLKFSRREESRLNRWASRWLSSPNLEKSKELSKKSYRHDDRYKAINLVPDYTIEFRFFRGTTNHNTVLACIQLIDNLILFAGSHTDEYCQETNFRDIINYVKYEELTSYCESKGLA